MCIWFHSVTTIRLRYTYIDCEQNDGKSNEFKLSNDLHCDTVFVKEHNKVCHFSIDERTSNLAEDI